MNKKSKEKKKTKEGKIIWGRKDLSNYIYENTCSLSTSFFKKDCDYLTWLFIKFFQDNLSDNHIIILRGLGTFNLKTLKSVKKRIPNKDLYKKEKNPYIFMETKERFRTSFKESFTLRCIINEKSFNLKG